MACPASDPRNEVAGREVALSTAFQRERAAVAQRDHQ